MDAENIGRFKDMINSSIKELSKHVVDFEVDADGDEYDEMQASAILDIAYAERDRYNYKINSMSEALERIDSGDYGYCEECGEEIGIKRLEIFPDAKYCIVCAEKIEKDSGARRR